MLVFVVFPHVPAWSPVPMRVNFKFVLYVIAMKVPYAGMSDQFGFCVLSTSVHPSA